MSFSAPYQDNRGFFDESREGDRWAFRWFVLVSFLFHALVLIFFLKDPAFHQAVENLIAAAPKKLTPLEQRKRALEKKPVFIDLVDPSKVPLKQQSMAPELPKGFSINGKPKGVEHHTETARPVPRMVPQRPVPPDLLARTEAPREAPKADNSPGFRQVKKAEHHEKENHAKAVRGKVTPKPEKKSAQPKKMAQKPQKPVVSHPLTKEQIQKILAQESLGNPLTQHIELEKEAPAYSDRQSELDRIAANLEDETYSSYIRRIQERFETIGEYPPDAAARGTTGRALVTFTINADGTLAGADLTQGSGSAALDEESLRIVRVAAPYIPLPSSFHKKKLTLTWAFIFYNGGFHVVQ